MYLISFAFVIYITSLQASICPVWIYHKDDFSEDNIALRFFFTVSVGFCTTFFTETYTK